MKLTMPFLKKKLKGWQEAREVEWLTKIVEVDVKYRNRNKGRRILRLLDKEKEANKQRARWVKK